MVKVKIVEIQIEKYIKIQPNYYNFKLLEICYGFSKRQCGKSGLSVPVSSLNCLFSVNN